MGNFLFKIAATIKLCKVHNCESIYPDYFLWRYLDNPPAIYMSENIWIDEIVRPRVWEWSQQEEEWLDSFGQDFKERNMQLALNFFFQSAKWFEGCEREVVNALKIKQEEKDKVRVKYDYIWYPGKDEYRPTIGISIRLGDFVGHGDYFQIPYDWYIKALNENFPNWKDRPVVVFSDDIEKAKQIFKDYPFYYADPNGTHSHKDNFKHYHSDKAIEQFILGTMMDDFIIGNSTFSWWIAYLAQQNSPFNKVIHCGQVFSKTGNMKHCDTSNYYHPSWIKQPIK